MIRSFRDTTPEIAPSAHIDDTAVVIGDVTIDEDASVWPNAVLRADGGGTIHIRAGSNIQDGAVCHSDAPDYPVDIGPLATVGHAAIVHNAHVGERALVGMNAVVLDDAVVEPYSIVAAGSVVTEATRVASETLVGGTPATVLKDDLDRSSAWFNNGEIYIERARLHAEQSEDITHQYHQP